VRHTKGKTTPVLTLDPHQFEPSLALLRKNQYSLLLNGGGGVPLQRNFLMQAPELVNDLKLFESEDEPFSFAEIYDTPETISSTVSNINILIRYANRTILNTVYI
jgi:hypothetical protein